MKSFKKSISILLGVILLSLFTSCINVTINKNESEQLAKTEIIKSEDTKKNIETVVETTEDSENDDTFSDVTSLSKKEVDNFASRIKNYYINNDFDSISKIMLYPINYDKEVGDFSLRSGGIKINNEKEFMDLTKDFSFSNEDITMMKNASISDLWPQPSSGGISFGEGLVWFKDINFDGVSMQTIGDADLKIFALGECK